MSDVTEFDNRFGSGTAPAQVPQRAGQATQVEQARAIAEVRAAVMIAMDRPRDRTAAIAEMREVCGIPALAERAFFRVPRGGEHVNGESISLARELARVWGNIDYGVKELARDDIRGQSELLAFAWDLQTNARSEITFIVPHERGTGAKRKRLVSTQEVYENNASFAGRRLRETIFAILPVWFKAEAAEICHNTLANGGGKPLVQRVADLRAAFEAIGVSPAQLERKRGRRVDDFLPEDVAGLRVVYGSIKRGEVTVTEEFPSGEPAPTTPAGNKLDALESLAGAPEDEEDAFGLKPLPQTNPRAGAEPGYAAASASTPDSDAVGEGGRTVGSIPATGAAQPNSPAGQPTGTSTIPDRKDEATGFARIRDPNQPAGEPARPFATTDTAPSGGDGGNGDNSKRAGNGPSATTAASRSEPPERAVIGHARTAPPGMHPDDQPRDLLGGAPAENLAVPWHPQDDADLFLRQFDAMLAEAPLTAKRAATIRLRNRAQLERLEREAPDDHAILWATLAAAR